MFNVDDNMLNDLGLANLQGQDREEFKDYLKTTLQERVGERLTEGMSDEKLDEFSFFMDGDVDNMKSWLSNNVPNYENDPAFVKFIEQNKGANESELLASYGSLMWLNINCPDYPNIVKNTLEELKEEVRNNSEAIINSLGE